MFRILADSHGSNFFNIKLSLAAYSDDVCFFPVYTVLTEQLIEAVGIARL